MNRFKRQLKEEFKDIIKDQPNEIIANALIIDAIYAEMNNKMPLPWHKYGFGSAEKESV